MILLQADTVNGIYEVTEFDAGYTVVCDTQFVESLSEETYKGPIACATSSSDIIAQLISQYSILRLNA